MGALTTDGGELNPATVTAQTRQPQQPVTQQSSTLDNILNGKRTFTPNAQTRDAMNAWGLNHFVPDSRLTGDTPRDAMNRWNIQHGNVAQQPVTQPQQQTETPQQPAIPTFGQDLKNEWRGLIDNFRKPENRKADPNLGKYNVPPPGPDASMGEWAQWFQKKTDYENEVEKKRQKRNQTISSLGDMFNALSNLYFTTQYAPSWYNDKTSMTDRQRERYDKLNAARDANNQAYLNMYLKAAGDEDARKFQRENAEREAELKREGFASNERIQAGHDATNITINEGKNASAEKIAEGKNASAEKIAGANNEAKWNLALKQYELKTADGNGPGGSGDSKNGPVTLVDHDSESQYKISRKIWSDNYQQAFDMLKGDLKKYGRYSNKDLNKLTDAQKESLVKQTWYLNDNVKDYLLKQAETDAATMENRNQYTGTEVNIDDDSITDRG